MKHSCYTVTQRIMKIIPLFMVITITLNTGIITKAAELNENLRPFGEIIGRYDYMDNYDFNNNTNDKEETFYARTRLGLDFGFKHIGGRFQIRDFRQFGNSLRNFPDKSNTKIREAYIDLISIPLENMDITIGRQEIAKGEERILGSNDWHWIGYTHDAISIAVKPTPYQKWNALFIKVGESSIADGKTIDNRAYVSGFYTSFFLESFEKLEPYYFYQNYASSPLIPQIVSSDSQGKDYKVHTFGLLTKLNITENLFLGFEGNLQSGDFGTKNLESFLLHTKVGVETGVQEINSVILSYDIYSGDKDPNDNTINTYQPIFPSYYEHTGLIGWFGMKNLTDLRLSLSGDIFNSLTWKIDGHLFSVHRLEDGVYLPNNTLYNFVYNSASYSSTSNDLGREVDIILSLPLIKDMTLTATMSSLEPGKYVEDSFGCKGGTNTHFTIGVKWGF